MDVKSRVSALERRLRGLTSGQRPHYTVLLAHGVPLEDWTDEELNAYLCDIYGLPPDTELTGDMLNEITTREEAFLALPPEEQSDSAREKMLARLHDDLVAMRNADSKQGG